MSTSTPSSFLSKLTAALLIIILVLAVMPVKPVYAANYTVSSLADNTTNDAFCTLREAILAANNAPANANCGPGSAVADTITFSANGAITLGSQLPAISTQITITGNGAANTFIQANANPNVAIYRVFEVTATGNLTLNNLTARNGRCNGSCATSTRDGGGIYNNGGTVNVTNSVLSGNTATGNGGGISNVNSGRVNVTNSTLSGNTATGNPWGGGGIYSRGGAPTLNVTNSTFSGNSGPYGGGIYNYSASQNCAGTPTATVTNSTFSGNTATTAGGGIYNYNGLMSVTSSTIVSNTAPANTGGGVRSHNDGVTCTRVGSTIIAGNSGSDVSAFTTTLRFSSLGYNVIGTAGSNVNFALEFNQVQDVTNVANPQVGALANNGGPTQTRALLTGSPAINRGSAACPATDQRGVSRPQGAACDSGAYELAVPVIGTVTVSPDVGGFTSAAPTISAPVTSAIALTGCEYTTNGTAWSAGTVTGAAPNFTCTGNPSGLSGALTINVRATNAGGTGTGTAINRTVDVTGPTDGVLTVTPGDGQNGLSWTVATDSGSGLRAINTYDVRFQTGATPPTCSTGTSIYTGTNLTYTHNGLTNGTQYSYRVCAYDALNNISAGATGTGTPQAVPVIGTVTVSPDVGGFTSAAPTISAPVTSAIALTGCQYTTNGSSWAAGTVTGSAPNFTCTGNPSGLSGALTINVRATNASGTGTGTAINRTVDNTAPTTSATPAGGLYNAAQSVTLACSDAGGSGCASTLYCLGAACAPATSYAGVINITASDVLRFYSTDNTGNSESIKTETYTIDTSAPAIASATSTTANGSYNAGDAINITVNFSESISSAGLTITLDTGVVITTGALNNVSSYSGTYTVGPGETSTDLTVTSITGTITDAASNNTVNPTVPAGQNIADGKDVVIDTTAPSLTSFTRQTPATSPTNADTLVFRATFSEAVQNMDAADFAVTGTTAPITGVTGVGGGPTYTQYDITVSGGDLAGLNGTVGVDLAVGQDIADLAGNSLPTVEPAPVADETYLINNTAPIVVSTDLAAGYTGRGPGNFTVTFSKDVSVAGGTTGADSATNPVNYLLVDKVNGIADTASCGPVPGAGGVQPDDIQVTVSGVTYDSATFTATVTLPGLLPVGTYRLFVCGTTSIVDAAGNPLNGGTDYTFDFVVSPRGLPATGFPQGRVTVLPVQPASKAYASTDMVLEIPSLKQKMTIVGVPQTEKSWDVSWLGNNAGWLEGSAFPTWDGNTVLTGHVWDSFNRPGPFANLKNLKYGDQFFIHAYGMTYTYEVRENKTYWAKTAVSKVFQHEELDWVTLVTCETYNPVNGDYFFRRAVRAVLISVK